MPGPVTAIPGYPYFAGTAVIGDVRRATGHLEGARLFRAALFADELIGGVVLPLDGEVVASGVVAFQFGDIGVKGAIGLVGFGGVVLAGAGVLVGLTSPTALANCSVGALTKPASDTSRSSVSVLSKSISATSAPTTTASAAGKRRKPNSAGVNGTENASGAVRLTGFNIAEPNT